MSFNSKYSGQQVENLLDQVANGNAEGGGGSSSGGNGAYAEVNHGTSDTTFTLTPNTFHVWDEVASLDLSFADEQAGVANEYLFQFTSGATATTLTLPDGLKWANDSEPTIKKNMIYQVSVLKGLASVLEFDNATATIPFYVKLAGEWVPFVCNDGMTWREFISSDFNKNGTYILSIDGNEICYGVTYIQNQTPDDVIIADTYYDTYLNV